MNQIFIEVFGARVCTERAENQCDSRSSFQWQGFLVKLLAILVMIFRSVVAHATTAVEYELEGQVETFRYLKGSREQTETLQFHVYVRDCAWLIHVVPQPEGSLAQRIDYWEMASDGKEIYSLAARKHVTPTTEGWTGAVLRYGVPQHLLLPQIPVVWFATASSCFLDRSNVLIPPPYSTDLMRLPVKADITREVPLPRLVRTAIFHSEGYDPKSPNRTKYPAPFDAGFTNAVYSALEFTNVGGLLLPLDFTLQVYRPSPKGLEIDFLYRASITEARLGCSLSELKPGIPGEKEGLIKDLRFVSAGAKSEQPFQYHSRQWLTEEQVRTLEGFSNYVAWEKFAGTVPSVLTEKRSAISFSNQGTKRVRFVVVLLILAMILVPILVWRYIQSKKSGRL